MPYFEHRGAKLHYEERGTGQALVFLHGASWDLRQWQRQMAHFSPRYRVVALDARGHGQSTLPPGPGARRNSFGTMSGPCWTTWPFPRLCSAACPWGGPHRPPNGHPRAGAGEGPDPAGHPLHQPVQRLRADLRAHQPGLHGVDAYEMERLVHRRGPGGLQPVARAYIRQVVSAMDHDVFNRVWKAATTMESRPGLCQITCPTLLLIGDRDKMTGRQQAFLHQSIAGSTLSPFATPTTEPTWITRTRWRRRWRPFWRSTGYKQKHPDSVCCPGVAVLLCFVGKWDAIPSWIQRGLFCFGSFFFHSRHCNRQIVQLLLIPPRPAGRWGTP